VRGVAVGAGARQCGVVGPAFGGRIRGALAHEGFDRPKKDTRGADYPGAYLAGAYNRLTSTVQGRDVEDEHLVNSPNWLLLDLCIDGGGWWGPTALLLPVPPQSGMPVFPLGEVTESARTVGLVLGVLARRRRLRERDSWSRQRLLAYQADELARLRRYACARSPFYRRFHAGALDARLSDLPVLTKAQVMEAFDELATADDVRLGAVEEYLAGLRGNELIRGRYYVYATAGTTGRRGVFVWNFAEWVDVIASYNRAFDWAGSTVGLTHRVTTAVVSSTNPSHQSARVGASIHSRWAPTRAWTPATTWRGS
jgi:hypothetical protein